MALAVGCEQRLLSLFRQSHNKSLQVRETSRCEI